MMIIITVKRQGIKQTQKNLGIHMFLTCVLKKKSLRLQHKQFKWPLGGFKLTGLHGNHQRAERNRESPITDITHRFIHS